MNLFTKKYDGNSIVDIDRDVCEAFDKIFNPIAGSIPQDEDGFYQGEFIVSVEWVPNEQD